MTTYQTAAGTLTEDEARAMPSFFHVGTKPDNRSGSCAACRKAQPHRMARRHEYACPDHQLTAIYLVGGTYGGADKDAKLALACHRAGGNPEPRYNQHDHPRAFAQWTYKRKGNKSDRLLRLTALCQTTTRDLVTA